MQGGGCVCGVSEWGVDEYTIDVPADVQLTFKKRTQANPVDI